MSSAPAPAPALAPPARRRARLAGVALLGFGLLLAGGCAGGLRLPRPGLSEPAPATDWSAEQARLAALQGWTLAGRVAVRSGQEGFSASLTWSQDGAAFRLGVTAALARQAIAIEGAPGRVTLTGLEGGPRTAADAEALMREALGWSVPMAGLHWWIRGIPDPALPVDALESGPDGRPTRMRQAGWQIDFERPVAAGDVRLPGRITLEREQARVRLVITRWTTH